MRSATASLAKSSLVFGLFLTALLSTSIAAADDLVEFLNGTQLKGEILQIRKPDKEFDFKCLISGSEVTQTIPYARVHAVTLAGKRFVLTPKNEPVAAPGVDADGRPQRTPEEVQQLIDTVGSSDPDWLASTDMNHPKTLDLSWPEKPGGPWDESKNITQYIWGRVNPNASRWKSGIKLVHHCIGLHQGQPDLLRRDKEKLGVMYFQLLQDYERAAYWLQQAKVQPTTESGIHLCECYWRLGSKPLAMKELPGKRLHISAIKLLGDMGEADKAIGVTKYYEKTNLSNEAWLNAGDALRSAGKLNEAVAYYQKVLDQNQARNQEYLARFRGRATEAIEAIRLYDKADVSKVADGTYRESATGYNGKLEVELTVNSNRITQVRVTKHSEKQFYAALTDTPNQILEKQSYRDIDGTSGATITSQAIISATAKALAKGAR
ncbi:FMN-binding protein [Blastopirellula sp. JC732]|uniref:FMN-binding protein n=1 Tax=Blastopirellula sediminis TaxID=2894196 RepID=A0A9X1SF25_9BACT|nr:FMN-binding protein [Blastopirellula sediminis]MCC9608638.1 FMN-binding protein [Blastopirellula sediminis]MCC9628585.1 FMN-binding protein [Blastopirellula sediminis]